MDLQLLCICVMDCMKMKNIVLMKLSQLKPLSVSAILICVIAILICVIHLHQFLWTMLFLEPWLFSSFCNNYYGFRKFVWYTLQFHVPINNYCSNKSWTNIDFRNFFSKYTQPSILIPLAWRLLLRFLLVSDFLQHETDE